MSSSASNWKQPHLRDGQPLLSVVSPIYGCAGCVEELADRVASALIGAGVRYELILIDDASPDDAWSRIVELSATRTFVRGLRLSRNFGQHAAIAAGLRAARGDVVVVMDCDLQDRPEEIPRLLGALRGDVKVAVARREHRQDGAFKRFGSWMFYKILEWLTGVPHDHATANFGAYARPVIDAVNSMPESNRFFPLLVKWSGFPTAYVPVQHATRIKGKSSYSFQQLLKLAINIALSYSEKPLRAVTLCGLAFSAVSLAFVGYSVFIYLQGDIQVAGFTSIIASIWLLGGITISSIGVSGLYVGRIFMETKRRPWFIVADQTNCVGEGEGHDGLAGPF